MLQVLRMRYPQVESMIISPPFLIIECEGRVPAATEQVFMAAGLVCVFIVVGGRIPFGAEFIGRDGEAQPPSDVPEEVSHECRPFNIPKLSTFEYIHKLIPTCTHVSSYPTQLVVELQPLPEELFEKHLEKLPGYVGSMSIGYMNGLLLRQVRAHAKAPDPTNVDSTCDDSNYLSPLNGGSLRPGIFLECRGIPTEDGAIDGIMLTNSGVKVTRETSPGLRVHGTGGRRLEKRRYIMEIRKLGW